MRTRVLIPALAVILSLGHSTANAQAGQVAMAIAKPIIEIGLNKAMAKAGLDRTNGVLPAIQRLETSMGDMNSNLEDITSSLKDQNFTAAYRQCSEARTNIQSQLNNFKTWVNDLSRPPQSTILALKEKLDTSLTTLQNCADNPELSVIQKLMKSDRSPKVSDLNDYWYAVDELRAAYVVSLAQAVTLMEGVADLQERSWKVCQTDNGGSTVATAGAAPKPVQQEVVFTGRPDTVCRDARDGKGGNANPKDKVNFAAGDSNRYFDLATSVRFKSDCEQACKSRPDCRAIEFYSGREPRCELWKIPAVAVAGSDYGCYIKGMGQASAPLPTLAAGKESCDLNYPRISPVTLQEVRTKAQQVMLAMYMQGVPLVENRNAAKFIHVRGEDWALSPPSNFSGYFGTTVGERMRGKLLKLVENYKPSDHKNMTLESFLETNHIPTRYFDQNSWACSSWGGIATEGKAGYDLKVRIDRIVGNRLDSRTILLERTSAHGGVPVNISEAYCQNRLQQLRSTAGNDYQLVNGAILGGVIIKQYWEGVPCSDTSLCDPPRDLKVDNKPFFGRFFTYNLSQYDAQRACSRNPGSKQCLYSGKRLDAGGRAALRSQPAAVDYIRSSGG